MHKQQAWEYCQAKLIQTLERASQGVNWSWSQCIKSHHAQTSSGKGLPSHFWNRNIVRSILPWLRRKITGLLLSGPKSSFQIKVNCAFNLEIKAPESGGREERHRIDVSWSPVWSFHSLWWFGLLVICWCWSSVFSEVHSQRSHLPGHFRALHASFCWQALWRCWFYFPAELDTCPHFQRYQKLVQWPWHGVTVLDWPANPSVLNPMNLWGIVKRKMRDTRPNNADDLKAAIKATWASLHLSSATGWLPRCHAALMQWFMQKKAQPSIECIEMNILFRSLTFLFKIFFFYWSYVIL